LALLMPFPQSPFTWRCLLANWPTEGRRPAQPQIAVSRPQIASAEELEILEPLIAARRYSLATLLEGKLQTPGAEDISLKNWLFQQPGFADFPNPYLLSLTNALAGELRTSVGDQIGLHQ